MAETAKSPEHTVAVVTGSNGIIGSEICRELRTAGYTVVGLDSSALQEEGKSETDFQLHGSVTDKGFLESSVEWIEEDIGPIAALVNGAATKTDSLDQFYADFENYKLDVWNELLFTNLTGMFLVAQAVVPRMAARRSGAVVQISSVYGATMGADQRIYVGSDYNGKRISNPVAYQASKAGVHGLTLFLGTKYGVDNVRVNTVSPGGVRSGQNFVFQEQYSARVPLGRMASAREIAAPIGFLLSDRASYITCQNIFVDGGLSGW